MIIVEGPDGAGKTTLIHQLQMVFGLPVAPRVVSKDTEAMVDLTKWVEDNLELGFQPTIFDRYRLISEPIYGPILRDARAPGFNNLRWMTEQMHRLYQIRPIIIYCIPPIEVVVENLTGDVDNSRVWDKIENIHAAYVARAAIDVSLARSDVHIYDYTEYLDPKSRPHPMFRSIADELRERSMY